MSELSVGQLKGLTVNNNVMTVPSGHTLYAPGHIVQVQSQTLTSTLAISPVGATGLPTTSNTYSILTCAITPKFSTSKILIFANIRDAATNSTPAGIIFRGSTAVGIGDGSGNRRRITTGTGYEADTNQIGGIGDLTFLDSPNTTSQIIYDIRMSSDGGSFVVNRSVNDADSTTGARSISTITLMEIAQ